MSEYGYLFDEVVLESTSKIKGKSIVLKNKHEQKLISRFDELKSVMPEIEHDKTIHLISSDNFGSIELLKYFIEKFEIQELIITTWSFNQVFIDLMKDLKTNITFFVDKSIKGRKSHLYNQLAELAIDGKIKMKTHHMMHSKVTLIKTKDFHIVIEGSANYSENQRIENYTITENKDLFIFHKNWMNELIGK